MKKLITGLVLMLLTTVSYAKTFECTGYADGSAIGAAIKVNAAKIAVAETKAKARMKKEGKKVDYVKCE
jgi:hypothetical protein